MANEMLDSIRVKKQKLQSISKELKQDFEGLDDIIDEVIRNIEVWYILPDLITRPVIINLWGMTGTGKTDLVRKLVAKLGYNDKFLEIQLCNKGSATGNYRNLSTQLNCSNLDTETPGILLLDEMQRFRTIDENKSEIADYNFQDLWMILSDGKFCSSTTKDDIAKMIFGDYYASDNSKNRTSYSNAKYIKKILKLKENCEEIMLWDEEKRNNILSTKLNDPYIYEGASYSKLLIFISGNLDEAFSMSKYSSDVNHDADAMHSMSKNINIITIKDALNERFKPEQIARFGNNHIIYPSLNKKSYCKIIEKKINEIVVCVKKKHDITLNINQSVNDFVYRNGVYPSQGVRPLFSTISSYLENSMPILILEALENDINEIDLSYKDNNLIAENKKAKFVKKIKCIGTIDSIKSENDLDNDRRIKTSIHEAAHAVVYAKLFEISPTQIDANTASDRNSGFIGIHNFVHSKNTTLDIIKVYMAGTAIESIVFGEDSISNGASADIIAATKIASQGIKEWGFFNNNSYIKPENINQGLYANNSNSNELNDSIEQLVSQQKEKVTELLEANMDLLKEVADYLFANYSIEPVVFKDICQKHGLNIEVRDAKYTIHEKYWQKYDQFFNKSRNDKKYVTSKINYPMLKLAADKNEKEKTEEITDEK